MSVTPAGPEFQVNVFTEGSQRTWAATPQSVASDADGDFVVTWNSYGQDGYDFGIYARRYNAAGVAQGSEFQVNSITYDMQRFSTVAMDADGDFVITWSSYSDGFEEGIYARRYNADGVPQGAEFQVNTNTLGTQFNSNVAMDADGDFVVVWNSIELFDRGYGVYAQRYSAQGVAQGGEFRVNTYNAGVQTGAKVAMDADGDFVVTWEGDDKDGTPNEIYAQRYDAQGVAQGAEFRVNSKSNSSQHSSTVAMDANGNFVVTWSSNWQDGDGYGIFGQRYNAAGQAEGAEFRINTYRLNDQLCSSVAMDADGDFTVTWTTYGQDGSDHGIYAQRFDAEGTALGSEFQVNSYTRDAQMFSTVAMDGDGDFVIAWKSFGQDSDDDGIYARRYFVNGRPSDVVMKTFTSNGFTQAKIIYRITDTPSEPFDIGFYRSADAKISGSDKLLDTVRIKRAADLTVGRHTVTFTIGKDVRLPGAGRSDLKSDYHLLAVADHKQAIEESNDNNAAVFAGVYHVRNGSVFVHGRQKNDKITLAGEENGFELTFNGATYRYRDDVDDFRVRAHAGNDKVDAEELQDVALLAWGGSGDDTIHLRDRDDGAGHLVDGFQPLFSDAYFERVGHGDSRKNKKNQAADR